MLTSAKELRNRLREFLADVNKEQEFREWFALALRDSHKSGTDVEALAHEIMWVFLDQRRGLCSPEELSKELQHLTVVPELWTTDERYSVRSDAALTSLQKAEQYSFAGSRVEIGPALEHATKE